MGHPVAVDFLGDAQGAGVEFGEHGADRCADLGRRGTGLQRGAVFPRLLDNLLEFLHVSVFLEF